MKQYQDLLQEILDTDDNFIDVGGLDEIEISGELYQKPKTNH